MWQTYTTKINRNSGKESRTFFSINKIAEESDNYSSHARMASVWQRKGRLGVRPSTTFRNQRKVVGGCHNYYYSAHRCSVNRRTLHAAKTCDAKKVLCILRIAFVSLSRMCLMITYVSCSKSPFFHFSAPPTQCRKRRKAAARGLNE